MNIRKLLLCGFVALCISLYTSPQLFAAYITAPYFPIEEGNSWTYSNNVTGTYTITVLNGTVSVNNIDTVVLEGTDGLKSYLTNDQNGIRLHRQYDPMVWVDGLGYTSFDVTYSPPVKFAGSQAEIGSSIQSVGSAITTIGGLGTYYLDYIITSNIDGFESVTVPAGSFQALKNSHSINISGYISGQYVTETADEIIWMAKSVGTVKAYYSDSDGIEEESLVSTNVAPPTYSDFNRDLTSDVLFQHGGDGRLLLWNMANFVRTVNFPQSLAVNWSVVGKGDFNADGTVDVFYMKDTGNTAIAEMANSVRSDLAFPGGIKTVWEAKGVGDFDGDGVDDILWRRNTDGVTLIWGIVDSARAKISWPGGLASFWTIVGVGDFDADGVDDILCQHNSDGRLLIWKMDNLTRHSVVLPQSLASSWSVVGVGDFNDDGTDDVLYRKDAGDVAIAEFKNLNRNALKFPGGIRPVWQVKDIGDYDGDGSNDILFQRDTDSVTVAWGVVNSARVKIAWPGGLAADWLVK